MSGILKIYFHLRGVVKEILKRHLVGGPWTTPRRWRSPLPVFCLSLLLAASCGYSTRSVALGKIKKIYVAPFKNKIAYGEEKERNLYLPLLEVKVTNAIVDRFLFDGNLKIATEDTADVILKGDLIRYERHPLRYDDNDEVQEYRINITVSMSLWNLSQNPEDPVWLEPYFVGETTYFTSGALISTEDVAVEKAVLDLARRVVERTVLDW